MRILARGGFPEPADAGLNVSTFIIMYLTIQKLLYSLERNIAYPALDFAQRPKQSEGTDPIEAIMLIIWHPSICSGSGEEK